MARKNSFITVTDQFCGAGGSSQGVRRIAGKHRGGIEVKLALNHWKLAIETHNTNFPDTLHDCTDIQACDPRRYPSTDILITSPECTNHSLAKGQKQVKKQLDLFTAGKLDAAKQLEYIKTVLTRYLEGDMSRYQFKHEIKTFIKS